jgi:hypothetical protein
VREYKQILKKNDTIAAILALIGYVVAVIEYEDYYNDVGKAHLAESVWGTLLRSVVSLTTFALLFLVYRQAKLNYSLSIEKALIDPQTPFTSTKHFRIMLLELVINAIHQPPFLNYNFDTHQLGRKGRFSLDQICSVLIALRFYLVARIFAIYSKWCNETAEDCCEAEGCEANTMFALKAVLKEKPYTTLFILMLISCTTLGLAVRAFERVMYYTEPGGTPPSDFKDYNYIWNGMWLIAITMTTVGYGDFFAVTHLGRIVSVIACFWGVFLVSMMVVTLTVSSSFDVKESRAYEILYRLNVREEIRQKAGLLIVDSFRVNKLKSDLRKNKIDEDQYRELWLQQRNQLETDLEIYRQTRNKLPDFEVPPVELLRQLNEKIDIDFEQVKDLLAQLILLEGKIQTIEKNQQTIIEALKETVDYTGALQDQIIRFRNTYLFSNKNEDDLSVTKTNTVYNSTMFNAGTVNTQHQDFVQGFNAMMNNPTSKGK